MTAVAVLLFKQCQGGFLRLDLRNCAMAFCQVHRDAELFHVQLPVGAELYRATQLQQPLKAAVAVDAALQVFSPWARGWGRAGSDAPR